MGGLVLEGHINGAFLIAMGGNTTWVSIGRDGVSFAPERFAEIFGVSTLKSPQVAKSMGADEGAPATGDGNSGGFCCDDMFATLSVLKLEAGGNESDSSSAGVPIDIEVGDRSACSV
eukprot:GDKJ01064579.1.p2 GENE.GDKJ01064579.1~~GDKJ01064579.1.p2  ORF type:complete len:117 (-),score=3.27 GDKJ01064579.1:457-807(-)